jgi:hypothetical protein
VNTVQRLKLMFAGPQTSEPSLASPPAMSKTWNGSQQYELHHSIVFMDTPDFRKLADAHHGGRMIMSNGYVNDLMLREFFAGDKSEWRRFVEHITDKSCLEIGPAVLSPLSAWDVAARVHVIEPLLNEVEEWQRNNLGYSLFDGLEKHAHGAEEVVPEAVGKIDGAIYCRNCLDHTPHWPFILANMALYASPGCKLLLWLDLDHRGIADEGHYDITTDPAAFKRLIEALGFDIEREFEVTERHELNWGCFATKR